MGKLKVESWKVESGKVENHNNSLSVIHIPSIAEAPFVNHFREQKKLFLSLT